MSQGTVSKVHDASTQGLSSNPNLYTGLEWRNQREPDYKIFIYNVSARTLKFDRFGNAGLPIPGVDENDVTTVTQGDTREPWKYCDKATGKGKTVKAGKENEKWHFVTSIPQPVILTKFNDASNVVEPYEQDAIRYVVDLINANNLGRTLDTPSTGFSQGIDLSQSGVFFSLANPPFESDVRGAVDRMEANYKRLLEQAGTLELTDKAKLAEVLGGNPDYAFAADYFGKEVSWRRAPKRKQECPNCGEEKPSGRPFHMTSFGMLCVEQSTEAWQQAVKSGIKKYEDVPEEFAWKKAAKSEPATK
jgi:hypothetical protein